MSRLDEIKARLAHESERCCDHRNTEWGNCTDCMNTGHAHAPYIDGEAKRDMAALVAMARAVEAVADRIEPHADNLAARGDIETSVPLHNAVKSIRAALEQNGGAS